ncbi:proteophosphoglycan ppg4 [Rhodotorula toruloides]|uniref:Proteophosphoglycan ppg4 n=1 Tax=Rhodotorula toruloides TaxID=5286 RepID=A0A511KHG8_RHOTO|nr:proteophosphoglycan ppg4 [Rhodotorula toruloides]
MASTTPRSNNRHTSHSHSLVDDTPTRPPSGASFNTTTLTSLKPHRSSNNAHRHKMNSLGAYAGGQRAGLAQLDANRAAGGNRPNSRGSGFSLKASDLEGLGAGAGHADVIEADNTELARRRAEASFQREMEELRNARLSSTSGSSIDGDEERNRRFDDESASTRSDASRSSASSFGSLKIGLTGTRTTAQHQSLAAALDDNNVETTDDNLTYMTIPRTNESPAASPARMAAPAPTTAAPAPPRPSPFSRAPATSTNLFASPRPFVSSAGAAAPLSSSPRPHPSSTKNNENVPPVRTASYPSIPPPRTSPFHSFSPAAPSPSVPLRSPNTALPHRPSPLGRNSPILAQNTTMTTTGVSISSPSFVDARSPKNLATPSQGRSPLQPVQSARRGGVVIEDYVSSSSSEGDEREAGDKSTRSVRTALPDKTGLTEFLRSPEKRRSGFTPARKRAPTQAERRGESGESSEGRRSTEANLLTNALSSLTSKLAHLESENASSAARVAELEARLRAANQVRDRLDEHEDETRKVKGEVERLLSEERVRREELEQVVSSLRAQNAHLDATLASHRNSLDALRRQASTAAAQPTSSPKPRETDFALRSEVQDLKHALAALGFEVDGVRAVVEELLRDKEERDAAGRWEAEEEERREQLARRHQKEKADERTPRPARVRKDGVGVGLGVDDVPATPPSEESWISREEVEALRRDIEREEARRTIKSKNKPRQTNPVLAAAEPSYDSTYVPYYSEEASEASFVSATSATTVSTTSSFDAADEPDFARAERIFQSVPSHEQRRKTRPSTRSGKDRVVLLDEPSANLCANCHGRKQGLKGASPSSRRRSRGDGAEADEEDLAPADEERERRRRERKNRERVKVEEREKKARGEAAEKERRAREEKAKEREEHRRTLEAVLDRLEEDFAVQKKIYFELTAEYQAMTSRTDTNKRRVLANHLKKSIDVLEEKAREVKRYADALEDLYETMHAQTCPQRRRHAVV